ncbi:hypothetical protein AHF37_04114 [Paragonimus kellicotti]|nr:hypothetical protein AHF37_04114 [Paragonimus kellicotti]
MTLSPVSVELEKEIEPCSNNNDLNAVRQLEVRIWMRSFLINCE